MPTLLARFVVIILVLLCGGVAAQTRLEMISLQHRPASDLVPVIAPVLADGSVVQGDGFTLILRARPAEIAQVKEILARLDRAPRNLLITVRQAQRSQYSTQRGDAGADVDDRHADVYVRGYSTRGVGNAQAQQSVRALEGRPAFLSVGLLVPVERRSYGPDGSVYGSVEHIPVTTGFEAIANLQGDRVVVHLRPHASALSPRGGGIIETQRSSTSVSGSVGEWLPVAGLSHGGSHQRRGWVFSTRTNDEQDVNIEVKVDIAN